MNINTSKLFTDLQIEILKTFGKIDYHPLYRALGEVVLDHVQEQFETEGKHFGGDGNNPGYKWFDLSDSTLLKKFKKKTKSMSKKKKTSVGKSAAGKILQDTGLLASSLNYTVTPDGIEVGFGMSYGIFLQMGTVNMPPRPFLPTVFPKVMLSDFQDEADKFYRKVFGG